MAHFKPSGFDPPTNRQYPIRESIKFPLNTFFYILQKVLPDKICPEEVWSKRPWWGHEMLAFKKC
jgi:hypothetical protein